MCRRGKQSVTVVDPVKRPITVDDGYLAVWRRIFVCALSVIFIAGGLKGWGADWDHSNGVQKKIEMRMQTVVQIKDSSASIPSSSSISIGTPAFILPQET